MFLPRPPGIEEIEAHIPRISPVPAETVRPYWSVMVPTYNTDERYLRRTLQSVLCQDPGPEQMQIEVVDGGSTMHNPETVVEEVGRGRIDFYRLSANRGASNTFNAAVNRSRGHWVHLLHGDDMVAPRFYEVIASAINAHPAAVMVVSGATVIDEHDRVLLELPRDDVAECGILKDFADDQGFRQMAWAAPAVVVRRPAYELAGGYCTWFSHVLDMDMWLRIALQGDVAVVRHPYALCRKHSQSATASAIVSGDNIRERVLLTLLNHERLRSPGWAERARVWKRLVAQHALEYAWAAEHLGSTRGRLTQASWVFRLTPGPQTLWFLAKSWLKHCLSVSRRAPRSLGRPPF